MSILNQPYFRDEEAAHSFLESIVWKDGPVCPHCGVVGHACRIKANPAKRVRYGLHKCGGCKKQFTVKIGTVFEHLRLPLHKALQAAYLLCASKKGISSNQLSRTLQISLKAAWFLSHRVREAMRPGGELAMMGQTGEFVEMDETYIGRKVGRQKMRGVGHKMAVMSLVERGGAVRSFHINNFDGKTLSDVLEANVSPKAHLRTDELPTYKQYGHHFASHETVNHSKDEYVRGDAYTNTLEGYFSIFKRGMKGIYQHCDEQHLQRYLAEFDFRYSNRVALNVDDFERTIRALAGISGKRLTYKKGVDLAS
jgi:transposase-like protein